MFRQAAVDCTGHRRVGLEGADRSAAQTFPEVGEYRRTERGRRSCKRRLSAELPAVRRVLRSVADTPSAVDADEALVDGLDDRRVALQTLDLRVANGAWVSSHRQDGRARPKYGRCLQWQGLYARRYRLIRTDSCVVERTWCGNEEDGRQRSSHRAALGDPRRSGGYPRLYLTPGPRGCHYGPTSPSGGPPAGYTSSASRARNARTPSTSWTR